MNRYVAYLICGMLVLASLPVKESVVRLCFEARVIQLADGGPPCTDALAQAPEACADCCDSQADATLCPQETTTCEYLQLASHNQPAITDRTVVAISGPHVVSTLPEWPPSSAYCLLAPSRLAGKPDWLRQRPSVQLIC